MDLKALLNWKHKEQELCNSFHRKDYQQHRQLFGIQQLHFRFQQQILYKGILCVIPKYHQIVDTNLFDHYQVYLHNQNI